MIPTLPSSARVAPVSRPVRYAAWCCWCGVLLACALVLKAQSQAAKVLILNSDQTVDRYATVQAAFKETLGKPTIDIDLAARKLSESQLERLLRDEGAESIYCIGSKAYLLANRVARERTIVMSSAINWQRLPTRKQTRIVATELPVEAQLTLFRYFFPQVKRIGVIYSPEFNREWVREAQDAAERLGVELVAESVRRTSSVPGDLKSLLPKVDALWLTADPTVLSNEATIRDIFQQCQGARKPVFTYSAAYAELGATLMISPDIPTIGRQAAGLLLAEDTGAQPVQSPAGSEITLNLRAVKALGLDLNEEAMDSVNAVIR